MLVPKERSKINIKILHLHAVARGGGRGDNSKKIFKMYVLLAISLTNRAISIKNHPLATSCECKETLLSFGLSV